MRPDRLGIERVPEVSNACRPVCFGPQESKRWLFRSPWPFCSEVIFCTFIRLQNLICGEFGLQSCAIVHKMQKTLTARVTPALYVSCLLLVSALCKLQLTFFPPSLCHASLSGSLLCSALKAMCARSCSCGLPDVDQQSSNIFMVHSSRICTSAPKNEEHKDISMEIKSCSAVCKREIAQLHQIWKWYDEWDSS